MRPAQRCAILLLAAASLVYAEGRRRALIVVVDGVRRDTFTEAYAAGRLPAFETLLGSGVWYDRAQAVVPTVTMAGQSSIFTGRPPERHGIPGNAWFSRSENRLYEYTNLAAAPCLFAITLIGGAECQGGLLNRHLQAPTIYEAASARGLRSVVSFHPVWRGATRALLPSVADGLGWLASGGIDFGLLDWAVAARAAQEGHANGLPDILTLYFAGVDEIAHSYGIAAQPAYLAEVVDPALAFVLHILDAREPGWLGSAMRVVTSDHGRTDAEPNPEDRTLARDLLAAVVRAGFPPEDVRLATNGGMAYVYLKSGVSWEDPAGPEAIAAVQGEIAADPVLARAVARVSPRAPGVSTRFGDLAVFLKPGRYFGNTGVGSHHGNIDERDLAVPLVVASPGLEPGRSQAEVRITQVAGTVAAFLSFEIDGADPPLPLPDGNAVSGRGSPPPAPPRGEPGGRPTAP